jgi:heme/copper-type cytochrome/quinol oxidase subunit 3
MNLTILLIISVAMGFVCQQVAQKKGRNPTLWLVVGFLFGIIAVIIISLLPHA